MSQVEISQYDPPVPFDVQSLTAASLLLSVMIDVQDEADGWLVGSAVGCAVGLAVGFAVGLAVIVDSLDMVM